MSVLLGQVKQRLTEHTDLIWSALKESKKAGGQTEKKLAKTAEFQQGITKQNTDIAEARAQTELLKQQGESDKAVLANKTAAKDQYQQTAAAAIQNVFSMIDSGEFTDDQILQQIQATDTPIQVGDQTSGNSMSLLKLRPKFSGDPRRLNGRAVASI